MTIRELSFRQLFRQFGARYFPLLMISTRLVAILTATFCVYYVNLTFDLTESEQRHFIWSATFWVLFAAVFTIWLAMLETRTLRKTLADFRQGRRVSPRQGKLAASQAIRFPLRHVLLEFAIDPLITSLPIALSLYWLDGTEPAVCVQVGIAGFLGITSILLATFFIAEAGLAPLIQELQANGVRIDFQEYPASKLQWRMFWGFMAILTVVLTMIASLAIQKTQTLIPDAAGRGAAIRPLVMHSTIISCFALALGGIFCHYLARSISARAARMINLMKEVQAGNLAVRLQPTGTDEIDGLARNFNDMIDVLERKERQIGGLNQNLARLNAGLEQEVQERTAELEQSRRELQESYDKLKQYDELKTRFFATISHELRTPLTAILTPLDQALDDGLKRHSSEALELFQLIHASGERLLKRINQLLDFAKLEAGRMELHLSAVNLNRLVRQLVAISRPIADKGRIQLDCSLDERIPEFAADEERLDMSIVNLLSNALKFTDEGGRVRIATRFEGNRVAVSVSDTGAGIAAEHHEMIFEDFFQLDGSLARRYDGTGLGLPFTRKLVELHGGQITVESELGAGSTFAFWIPCRSLAELTLPADAPQRQQKRQLGLIDHQIDELDERTVLAQLPPESPDGQAPRILVVEDTPAMRYLLARELAPECRLFFAYDGLAGWELAQKLAPDLILSDLMMPQLNGYELCRRVKSHPELRQTPFVLLTAKAEVDMKIQGLDQGADDYVCKPFNARELRARIRSLINLRNLSREVELRNHELQEALNQLRTAQAALVQSEKMASLGQLAAGIAHEINNSINFMSQSIRPLKMESESIRQQLARLVPERKAEDEALWESLAEIHNMTRAIEEGATRTTRIVRDLRAFSHPGGGADDEDPIDLHRSLDMCLTLLGGELRERIVVHRQYDSRQSLHGPQSQWNQVLLNLLNNAQQAISGPGEITIRTRDIGEEAVELQIQDTGCGIPADRLARIFDLFYTTKPAGVGTGIGLSLAYRIIQKMGGRIDCQSQVGVGTIFTILLPRRPRNPSLTPHVVHTS